ncbi:MAG: hypothetical protein JW731_15050 [Bacteroidales bacterium]|nr:hypothetical protein [Bacteroidales bacterium]
MKFNILPVIIFYLLSVFIIGCSQYDRNEIIDLTILADGVTEMNNPVKMEFIAEILLDRFENIGIPQKKVEIEVDGNLIHLRINSNKSRKTIEKLACSRGRLEFWETYNFSEVYENFIDANRHLSEIESKKNNQVKEQARPVKVKEKAESVPNDEMTLLEELEQNGFYDQPQNFALEEYNAQYPLFSILFPNIQVQNGQYFPAKMATVGYSNISDTSSVNRLLNQCKEFFPADMKFIWMNEPKINVENVLELLAVKISDKEWRKVLNENAIVEAGQGFDSDGKPILHLKMNEIATKQWEIMTTENIGRQIAIVIDDYVYMAPNVYAPVEDGNSTISSLTLEEAKFLAQILKSPALPCKLRIVKE